MICNHGNPQEKEPPWEKRVMGIVLGDGKSQNPDKTKPPLAMTGRRGLRGIQAFALVYCIYYTQKSVFGRLPLSDIHRHRYLPVERKGPIDMK